MQSFLITSKDGCQILVDVVRPSDFYRLISVAAKQLGGGMYKYKEVKDAGDGKSY